MTLLMMQNSSLVYNEAPIKGVNMEYKGKKYYLKDGYYRRSNRESGRLFTESLHRTIWEDHYGPIPTDHHIHHKNEVKTDNRIENLECLQCSDHHSLHFNTDKQRALLDEIRPLTKKWHKSEEGKEWHRENGRKSWENKKPIKRTCTICSIEFETLNRSGTKYCSQKCRSVRGYKSMKKEKECLICGNKFISVKGKACSLSCGATLAYQNRGKT